MSETNDASKKKALRELFQKLQEGASSKEVEEEFKDAVRGVSPSEMAEVEEEFIKKGLPRQEIQKMCDVHLAVLRESIGVERISAPAGHPIRILMEEHEIFQQHGEELRNVANEIKKAKRLTSAGGKTEQLKQLVRHLRESEGHYVREENVLFPSLEKHGITEPPAIMWMDHDTIRGLKKSIYALIDGRRSMGFQDFAKQLADDASALAEALSNHFYKENNVLFPTALQVMAENEWPDIRRQFDEVGYCCFTPEPYTSAAREAGAPAPSAEIEGAVSFDTGSMSSKELEALLNMLPVDITFVDKQDTVRYFSQSKDRVFPRAKAIIGRKVQQCHPEKSVHVVQRIVDDFRTGRKDRADFWINMKGRLVYIRYFAVRKDGEYLGCLEVTQDITEVKKIEGEKRLLEH